MANIQLKFNTLELDDTNNITISRIGVKDSKPVKTNDIPLIDGAIAEEANLSYKTITIEGDIAGTSHDNLRTNLDTLRAGLQGLHKFTTDDERYIMAQFKDFNYSYEHLSRFAKWSASFIAHFPFWLSETLYTDERVPTSGVSYIINNAGNAPARVKIEVTAPGGGIADNCQIENQTVDKIFQYRGTISDYETLEVDNRVVTDDFKVLDNGVSDFPNFEGDFIYLQPGNNTLIFTGTANAIVKLSWRAAWY